MQPGDDIDLLFAQSVSSRIQGLQFVFRWMFSHLSKSQLKIRLDIKVSHTGLFAVFFPEYFERYPIACFQNSSKNLGEVCFSFRIDALLLVHFIFLFKGYINKIFWTPRLHCLMLYTDITITFRVMIFHHTLVHNYSVNLISLFSLTSHHPPYFN